MSFSLIQVTAKGRTLLARAQTGENLNFTRIKMGDGTISGQIIDEMTDVINQKAALNISGLKVISGGKAKVQAAFNNQGMSNGFYWREMAVFATDPDNPAAEIMYCYGNAGSLAEYIPAQGTQILEKVISVLTIISNASNVTATIDSSNVYLTTKDADDTYIRKSLATAAGQFLVSSSVGQFVIKTVSEIKTLLGLGTAAEKNFNVSGGVASFDILSSHLSDYTMQIPWGGITTNIGNAYSLANPVIASLVPGMAVSFKCNADATGSVTLNWAGSGDKSVLKANSLPVANWKSGGVYTVRFEGTNFRLQGEGGEYGNVLAKNVTQGIIFGTENGLEVGTNTDKPWFIGDIGNITIPSDRTITLNFDFPPTYVIMVFKTNSSTAGSRGYHNAIFSKNNDLFNTYSKDAKCTGFVISNIENQGNANTSQLSPTFTSNSMIVSIFSAGMILENVHVIAF